MDDDGYENNPLLDKVQALASKENASIVALWAATEAELVELDDADRQEFMADLGLNRTWPAPGHSSRLRTVGFTNLFHCRGKRGTRLDHSAKELPHHKLQESFTRILKKDLSALK